MKFCFNQLKTLQAIAYLQSLSNEKMNHTRLLHLLFLADQATLLRQGLTITGSQMLATQHGPILQDVVVEVDNSLDTDELSRFELRILAETHAKFAHMDDSSFVHWLRKTAPEWFEMGAETRSISHEEILRKHGVSEAEIAIFQEEAEVRWVFKI